MKSSEIIPFLIELINISNYEKTFYFDGRNRYDPCILWWSQNNNC